MQVRVSMNFMFLPMELMAYMKLMNPMASTALMYL